MQTIRFYKCKPKMNFPVFSWLIILFQGMNPFKRGSYSHMAIGYISETGEEKIADVTSLGCRDRTKENFKKDYDLIEVKTREYEIERKDFLRWYEENEGKEYDNIQIAGLASKMISIVSFNKLGNNFKKLICSELILSFKVRFDSLEVEDSDNWDLNMTWEII